MTTPTVQKTGQALCHVRVREVAKAAAGELFEVMMRENQYYDAWRRQNPDARHKELERRFIERNWPKCIEFARQSLTMMLARHDIDDKVKDEIMDVLEKDASLKGRYVT